MNRDEIIEHLMALIKIDIDASNGYMQTIESIKDVNIIEQLMSFRDDHERHIEGLTEELQQVGEIQPAREKNFRGFLTKGFIPLKNIKGIFNTLEVMHDNELLVNKMYKEALQWDVPEEIHRYFSEYYEHEQKHIQYLDTMIHEAKTGF